MVANAPNNGIRQFLAPEEPRRVLNAEAFQAPIRRRRVCWPRAWLASDSHERIDPALELRSIGHAQLTEKLPK